jgi:hypothetical protein
MENAKPSKKAVHRSPNYPAISLAEAVGKVHKIYAEMYTHPADREAIAKNMGYTSLNGASASAISALQKFNLLEPGENKEEYKLSAQALNFVLFPKGNPDRVMAIKEIAFAPSTFHTLHERYGDRLPNDDVIRAYLIKSNFNPRAVSTVIRTFRDTIEFVKEEGAFDEGSDPAEVELSEASATNMHNTPEPNSSEQKQPAVGVVNPPVTQPLALPQMQLGNITDSQRIRVSRRGYVDITFYTETEVTQEIIEQLRSFLDNLKVTYPTQSELTQPRRAIWHGKEYDQEVKVTGVLGEHDGRRFFGIEGSSTGIPEDELEFDER